MKLEQSAAHRTEVGPVQTITVGPVQTIVPSQAIAQVLTPVFEPHFHSHSFGFRPGRSQHQAVKRARQFISDLDRWVAATVGAPQCG
jgi:hypothetical protein